MGDITKFDLMNMKLSTLMYRLDKFDSYPYESNVTSYVCYEQLDIVMNDDKRTTYSTENLFKDDYPIYWAVQKPWIETHMVNVEMLPYKNYPSNKLFHDMNTV